MSIYREIEETDKVFGRVRKVSDGLFSTGFELRDFYFDRTELTSSISGWKQPDMNSVGNPLMHTHSEINEFGVTTNYPTDDSVDIEETLSANKENWNNVSFGDYYVNVYNEETHTNGLPNDNSSSQFSISYGNKHGYGSLNESKSTSVTQAVYNQYKNILLGPGDSSWTFTLDSATTNFKDRDSIYVINFSSTNLKEKFDPGNLEFRLAVKHNDIVVTETFRDDSRFSSTSSTRNISSGKVYQIVRGSIVDEMSEDSKYATGTGEGAGEGFGFAYPDLGIIVLNPFALSCHFGTKIEEKLIDINSDGLLDLVIGEKNGILNLYLNCGNSTQFSWCKYISDSFGDSWGNIHVSNALGINGYSTPSLIKDGLGTHIIASNEIGSVEYFGLLQEDLEFEYTLETINVLNHISGYRSACTFGDLNSDGKHDCLMGIQNGGMRCYFGSDSVTINVPEISGILIKSILKVSPVSKI